MELKNIIIGSLLFYLSTTYVTAERDFSNISIKTTNVSNNIYMLEGVNGFAGGNIAVSVGDDGILIVDDQFSEMSGKIKAALSEIASGDISFVLNTHWHGDHTGSNSVFSNQATIIAHDNVRKRLMTDQRNRFGDSPAKPKEAWPVITFDQSLTIHFNNETIKLIHFPNGHTDGDSVIYFVESNVIHMGDHYFAGMFPFVDLNSNGNVLTYSKNIGRILEMIPDDIKVIPGHGALSTRNELSEYHKMLKESIAFVQNHINNDKSVEEIQSIGLPASIKKWETGFIKQDSWIEFIFTSIKG
jgi:cyclase